MSIVKTINLTKCYGEFVANDNINLSVKEHEIQCVVGENGAGKTTLMNMLYGMLQPTTGKILIHEKEVVMKNPVDAIENGLGMVHQHFKLIPSLTVFENILLGVEINKTLFKNKKSPIIDVKTEIYKVEELIEKNKFELNPLDKIKDVSVGSRQRVEILKMLYRNVDILILDEPTSVLTPQEADELMVRLKELKSQGKTIIVITHKLREVMELSDSVTVIKGGKVVGCAQTKDTNVRELAQMMVGHEITLTSQMERSHKKFDEVIYEAENLVATNDYGKAVVDNVSFRIHKGEILGIAGVEGNGQSELVKILTGIMKSDSGTIKLEGKNVTNQWPHELRKGGIGIIPEDRYAQGLCGDMSISENCIAGYHYRKDVCKAGILQTKCISSKRDEFVRDYDVRIGDLHGNVSGLSGGNAQKIIIAREMESDPKFIIACQPTRGVDIGSISFIHKQLLKFRDTGKGTLLISSELTEILSLSDRVLVMFKGKIVGEVNPKETNTTRIGLMMAGMSDNEKGGLPGET